MLIDDLLSVQELPIPVFQKESSISTSAFCISSHTVARSSLEVVKGKSFCMGALNDKEMSDSPGRESCGSGGVLH